MPALDELLAASAARHHHLCPKQVLGVRMGMLAAQILQLDLPQMDKRLLTIVETDGCFTDGVAVATGCWVGHRTLRIEDYGKAAATFVDTHTRRAIRIAPRVQARQSASKYAPDTANLWEAYLLGYQRMPADELFAMNEVRLTTEIEAIISRPERRAICEMCGEEIMNEREVVRGGSVVCRHCAGQSYYRSM